MSLRWIVVVAGVIGAMSAVGCAEVVEEPILSEAAARGGCRWDCPPCLPNQPCSLAPCVLECPPGVDPCGPTVCRDGEVCCNESCGICTEPGGFCIELYCAAPERGHFCNVRAFCAPGYRWSETACHCLPDGGPPSDCSSDLDCRTHSGYCADAPCTCSALGASEPDPVCTGDTVACFVDPCFDQQAICVDGGCQLAPLDTTWIDPAAAL